MGKRIGKIPIFAIVLFQLIISQQSANAGFYDWLISKEINEDTPLVTIHKATKVASDKSTIWNKVAIENKREKEIEVIKTYNVRATAYSSTPDQTDDTPFITASGTTVRDGTLATNMLPFGTRIRIPEIYGDKIFIVEDRMNKRYWDTVDIWFPSRYLALQFGSKQVVIEIIRES